MTLIAGTIVWNGICVGADTRATHTNSVNGNYTYTDDIQKIDMLPNGLGIAVAGDCDTATIFREILISKFSENTEKGDGHDGPANIIKEIIADALRELAFDGRVTSKEAEKTRIGGLIFGVDLGVSLRLDQGDCKRVLNIVGTKEVASWVWDKYRDAIIKCANEELPEVVLEEFPQSTLFSFESRLASRALPGILTVERIPLGRIEALGSGRSSDHEEQQKNTLFYSLFTVDPTSPEGIDDSAVHVLRTHGWAERVVPLQEEYGFQTFGGGYLAGAFLETPPNSGMVMFRVTLGEYFRDAARTDLVCAVYPNAADKLCIRTGDGREWVLKKFWEYADRVNVSMMLKIK